MCCYVPIPLSTNPKSKSSLFKFTPVFKASRTSLASLFARFCNYRSFNPMASIVFLSIFPLLPATASCTLIGNLTALLALEVSCCLEIFSASLIVIGTSQGVFFLITFDLSEIPNLGIWSKGMGFSSCSVSVSSLFYGRD